MSDTNLITHSAFDSKNENILWFIDPTSSILGKYDIETDETESIALPINGIVSGIVTDNQQNIWMTIMQENSILKFDIDKKEFETFKLPTENSRPVGLIYDGDTNAIWFTESIGKIGKLDIQTGNITEFPNQITNNNNKESLLKEPTSLLFDKEKTGNIYISDHLDNSIFGFNPLLSEFKKYPLSDSNGLAFGMVFDKYNNILIAQHVSDAIAVLDPATGKTINFNIPTTGSFVQYLITDSKKDVWFAEQKANALAKVLTKFLPPSSLSSTGTTIPTTSTQRPTTSAPTDSSIDSAKNNQTMMTFVNDIIKNTEINFNYNFNDVFGPIIITSLVVSAFLIINSSNRLNTNIRDIEKLEPPRETKIRKRK